MPNYTDKGMEQDSLPIMEPGAKFRFECGPQQPCFNRCCSQLNLMLTPYDAMRLSRNLRLPSREFLGAFTSLQKDPETGIPMFFLRMIESPDAPCPFVTPAGCSVYEDRPGACRSYPLGRGARLERDGVAERFFMVREEHCAGFETGPERTPGEWFASQQLERHIYFNDRFMRLLTMLKATGAPIDAKLEPMAYLCLWQPDNFAKFAQKMNLHEQMQWDRPGGLILEDTLKGEESALDFGLSWLEFLVFGQAPDLRRVKKTQGQA